jgi:hypothetical protein
MTDEELVAAWTTLDATGLQHRRMEARVFAWLEARQTSLAAEWLGLFRLSPIPALGLVAASTVSLATATPILWLARAFL